MASKRPYDPLDCIPSVDVIEQRLSDAQREARKLRVLLTTARKIAREAASAPSMKGAADE